MFIIFQRSRPVLIPFRVPAMAGSHTCSMFLQNEQPTKAQMFWPEAVLLRFEPLPTLGGASQCRVLHCALYSSTICMFERF